MCGIIGYTGTAAAVPILLDGLSALEYRGYDSSGICVQTPTGMYVEKTRGRLEALRRKLGPEPPAGTVGIGHTRWATHGEPSDRNSHPQLSDSGKIALVHNGIIENEARLRRHLEQKGVRFRSETDTEVVASLIGRCYSRCRDFPQAVRQAVSRLEGSFALGILCADCPEVLIAVKKDSPLIVGFGEDGHYIASDVTALLPHTRRMTWLEDGEMALLTGKAAAFFDMDGEPLEKKTETVAWEPTAAERSGYPHFMLKEILEQPRAVRDTLSPRLRHGRAALADPGLNREFLSGLKKITLVGCGSAYYVSVLGKYLLERHCRIPTEAVPASEFRYSHPALDRRDLVILISQSGETADTLGALREAKARGAHTLAIVNAVGSAMAREADRVLDTHAGPEIAVATTKAFSTQLALLYLLVLHMAEQLEALPPEQLDRLGTALERLPEDLEQVLTLEKQTRLRQLAGRCAGRRDVFFVGRNLDNAVCLEGSLKLKEVAYLHSEAYPAGELKHGPLAMIGPGTLVVALATADALFGKLMANIREVKARGAEVLCITLENRVQEAAQTADLVFSVPAVHPMLQPSLSLVPLQLLAYYTALERGCDVDKPRNLAKSVTVE